MLFNSWSGQCEGPMTLIFGSYHCGSLDGLTIPHGLLTLFTLPKHPGGHVTLAITRICIPSSRFMAAVKDLMLNSYKCATVSYVC